MNRWAMRNPEEMEEIAALPPSQQLGSLRDALAMMPPVCPECGGGGTTEDPVTAIWHPCPNCGGSGVKP